MAKKETKVVEPKKPKWEIKDRVYYLTGPETPITRIFKSKGIIWFDEEKGYEREVMATQNQRTVFVDEMVGQKRPQNIIFRDGMLVVPKNKVNLQKILSIYHPKLDKAYYEYKPEEIAKVEAVMRAIVGSEAANMSSKELRRDLLIQAKKNPLLVLDLINDDNVMLRNIGIKATEQNILNLSSDQRTFTLGSTGKKLFTVPFDEHPYSALAAWFKTDEGMGIFKGIEKRLK